MKPYDPILIRLFGNSMLFKLTHEEKAESSIVVNLLSLENSTVFKFEQEKNAPFPIEITLLCIITFSKLSKFVNWYFLISSIYSGTISSTNL